MTLAPEAIADIAKVKVSEGDKVIRAITGHTEPVSKKGMVKLDIAGYKRTVEVNFMGDNQMGIKNPYDIVIGNDTLTAFPANNAGYEKRIFSMGNKTISMKTAGDILREPRRVLVIQEMVIPAESEKMI